MDELPQFFNVLMGQMSLVGPRPPIPYELDNYQSWHMKRVLNVKPGITGLWQVKGRSLTTFDEMVRLDLHYANNWDLWLDLKILFSTFKVVFSGMGAV
jgi:lipopolysaccharide/colanic/teichoic acid biosynthesis glycosyltransferase